MAPQRWMQRMELTYQPQLENPNSSNAAGKYVGCRSEFRRRCRRSDRSGSDAHPSTEKAIGRNAMSIPVFDVLLFGVILISISYYFVLTNLTTSLRKTHIETWASLGEPGFLNYSIRNSNRLAVWVLFRPLYKTLKDRSVDRKIMILRSIAGIQGFLLLVMFIQLLTDPNANLII